LQRYIITWLARAKAGVKTGVGAGASSAVGHNRKARDDYLVQVNQCLIDVAPYEFFGVFVLIPTLLKITKSYNNW